MNSVEESVEAVDHGRGSDGNHSDRYYFRRGQAKNGEEKKSCRVEPKECPPKKKEGKKRPPSGKRREMEAKGRTPEESEPQESPDWPHGGRKNRSKKRRTSVESVDRVCGDGRQEKDFQEENDSVPGPNVESPESGAEKCGVGDMNEIVHEITGDKDNGEEDAATARSENQQEKFGDCCVQSTSENESTRENEDGAEDRHGGDQELEVLSNDQVDETSADDGSTAELSHSAEFADTLNMKRIADVHFRHVKQISEAENDSYTDLLQRVMAMVLDFSLPKVMDLQTFVKYVLEQTSMKQQMMLHEDATLPILNRSLPAVETSAFSTTCKELKRYEVFEPTMSYFVYKISTSCKTSQNSEYLFLSSMKESIIGSDINNIPLLLNGTGDDKTAEFLIPDYGLNLPEVFNTLHPVDRNLLFISVLAASSSFPATNKDMHNGNICLFSPDILFTYRWTIQLPTYLIQLSWQHHGLITVIDWESFNVPAKKSGSSFRWSSRAENWKLELKENVVLHIQQLQLHGESGMWNLINMIMQRCEENGVRDKVAIKYSSLSLSEQNSVACRLETIPNFIPTQSLNIPKILMRRWRVRCSDYGRTYKTKAELTIRDMKNILHLLNEFRLNIPSSTRGPIFPIPSDTGFVALKVDGTLIAICDIKPDVIVTMVTTTKRIQLFNDDGTSPLVRVGTNFATVMRKLTPFAGFGAFAVWSSKEPNCILWNVSVAGTRMVALKSSRRIERGEPIVCSADCVISSSPLVVNQEVSDFLKIVRDNVNEVRMETRQEFRQNEGSEIIELSDTDGVEESRES